MSDQALHYLLAVISVQKTKYKNKKNVRDTFKIENAFFPWIRMGNCIWGYMG